MSFSRVTAALVVAIAATSANASNDFADPYCDHGCRLIDNIKSGGDQIYLGSTATSYRICHADSLSLKVNVDGVNFAVSDGNNENRDCVDVNGKSIAIGGNGKALVGPIGH